MKFLDLLGLFGVTIALILSYDLFYYSATTGEFFILRFKSSHSAWLFYPITPLSPHIYCLLGKLLSYDLAYYLPMRFWSILLNLGPDLAFDADWWLFWVVVDNAPLFIELLRLKRFIPILSPWPLLKAYIIPFFISWSIFP